MKRLTRLTIVATFALAAFLFVFADVSKMLTTVGDFTVWRQPFSHRLVRVPEWMWTASVLGWTVGILGVVCLWLWVGLRSIGLRAR